MRGRADVDEGDLVGPAASKDQLGHERWSKYRFVVMLLLAISVAIALVILSLLLYVRSGAAQLDLSRPGFSDVRDQIQASDSRANFFSNSGPIDSEALEEFRELYEEYSSQATSVDAFGSDPLADIVQGDVGSQ